MISIDHVSKSYLHNTLHAVQDVSLSVAEGEIYGIVGYSGAGKSTLVRCLNFLERPDSGTITVSGVGTFSAEEGKLFFSGEKDGQKRRATEKDLRVLRSDIGMIFQHFNLLDRSTVFDNVAYPLKYRGYKKEGITARVRELLKLVSLEDKENSYPSELSGGQKQRVAIARALANRPKILLSDEATSALDPDATKSILNLLRDLNQKLGLTIVLITHEMEVVKSLCERMAVMEGGRVVEEGDVYEVFAHPRQEITKKFVYSSSHIGNVGEIFEANKALVTPGKDGILVKCTYDRDCVGEALISEVSRKFGVNISILLADLEVLKSIPLGSMIEIISGDREHVEAAIDYLRQNKVTVEVIMDGRMD